MRTLLFVDDRPCASNRPCSFNTVLFQRTDISIILLRFSDTFSVFSDSYLDMTSKYLTFMYETNEAFNKNYAKFVDWIIINKISIDYLCCMSEPKQEIAQSFGRLLGLSANSEMSTLCLRNKYMMKTKLKELGLNVAKFSLVSKFDDISNFLLTYGKSAILKPIDMYGTIDTYYIENINIELCNDLLKRYGVMLIEEYIPYQEFECCSLIYDKSLIDTYISSMPVKPIDIRSGRLNANISIPFGDKRINFGQETEHLMKKIIDGFDLVNGYVHMEFFYSKECNKIIIGEIAHRFPGCEIAKNHSYSHGFDIINSTIDCYLGIRPKIQYQSSIYVGDVLLPYKHGKIVSISSQQSILDIPGVLECTISFSEGDILPQTENSSFLCSGWVIVSGKNEKEIINLMEQVLNKYQLITQL